MLRMASDDLEAALDEQDAQIESLIKHCATLEAERTDLMLEKAQWEASRSTSRSSVWKTELTTPLERLRQRLRRQRVASGVA